MQLRTSLSNGLLALALLATTPSLLAFAPQEVPEAEVVNASASVSEVTLYQGRAMISRHVDAPNREGLFEIRFDNLPPSIEPASLQAAVNSDSIGAKLLDVRYEEKVTPSNVTNNPELRSALIDLDIAKRTGEELGMRMTLINDQYTLLNSIAQKTATESAKDFGSKALDPALLAGQVAFLASARNDLIDERMKLDAATRVNTDELNALQNKVNALGGATKVERSAIVTVGKSSIASADVTLRYLVRDAGWMPRYAIRADVEGNTLVVEYDAEIRQATGEDWKDVTLVLSTAQPTQRAAPSDVSPVYVDVYVAQPVIASGYADSGQSDSKDKQDASKSTRDRVEARKAGAPGRSGGLGAGGDVDALMAEPAQNKLLVALYDDAGASRSGTVVTFPIPRATSIPSDGSRTRKLRIATVDTKPTFVHVARPLVETAVYLKAVTANTSPYQFLAGPATVFLGGDSVGSTTLPDLAAGAEMTFWLGTDRRIEAKRVLVKKETVEKGMFDKADVTRWDYRIDLTSTDSKAVTLEVVDRMPVSRNEQIKIELRDDAKTGGATLSVDAKYIANEKPQGILKWLVQLPAATTAGKPSVKSIAWSVLVSKPKGVETTGLPD